MKGNNIMVNRNIKFDVPREVCFESTTACNCKCDFCYNKNSFAKKERKKMELSTKECKKLIDKVYNAGVKRIRFTGGEPLMRDDIFELAEYAKNKGLETVLNTNGILINEAVGKKVIKFFDICLISFFTCSSDYLESITNVKNIYDMKIKALENIQGCKQIWCSTIIRDPNLANDLYDMMKIMEKYNIYNWFLLRTNPIETNKTPHTFDEFEKIIDKIIEIKEKTGRIINIGNPTPLCTYKPLELMKIVDDGVLYAEARSKMVIDPLGNIVIDYCIRDKIGNIFEDNLVECWENEKLEEIRGDKFLPETCKKCKLVNQCRGGSRFASKIVYGKYCHMDPLARPEKYKDVLF